MRLKCHDALHLYFKDFMIMNGVNCPPSLFCSGGFGSAVWLKKSLPRVLGYFPPRLPCSRQDQIYTLLCEEV